jgi:Diacylglycerol kinase catalytic domain
MSNLEIGGQRIDRMVHFNNEQATNFAAIGKTTDRIVKRFSDVEHVSVSTTQDPDETVYNLRTIISEGDLVIVGGGEATVNAAAKAATTELPGAVIPHLILPAGNKNDLSNTLYVDVLDDPIRTINNSDRVAIHPLDVIFDFVGGERKHEIAISYVNMGLLAQICSVESARRQKHGKLIKAMRSLGFTRWLLDVASGLEGIATAHSFELVDNNAPDAQPAQLVEYGYINGSRMAGGFIETRIRIHQPQSVKIEQKNKLDLIVEMSGLAISSSGGEIVGEINDDLLVKSFVKIQLDGEARQLIPGDRVRIDRSNLPFYVLKNKKDKRRLNS